jgi:Zn-dependent protease
MLIVDALFFVAVLALSFVVHEMGHAIVADKLGDMTPRLHGRLSLNPFVHLDLVGSLILPFTFYMAGSPLMLGWAQTPINPSNLRYGRKGEFLVASAGIVGNLLLALLAAFSLTLVSEPEVQKIIMQVITMNAGLIVLNLIPLPPLDGSRMLSTMLPLPQARIYDGWCMRMSQNPFMPLVLLFGIVFIFGFALSGLSAFIIQTLVGLFV